MNEHSKATSQQLSRFSVGAFWNSGIRTFLWLVLMIGVVLFLVPEFIKVCEEFGTEMPEAGKLLHAISCEAREFVVVYVPLVFLSIMGMEVGAILVSRGFGRKIVNVMCWSLFAIMVLFFVLGTFMPTASMVREWNS